MKLFFFILSLKFLVFGTLFSQSYWFGGLTRMPTAENDGDFAVYFNSQSHSIDLTSVTDVNTGETATGNVKMLEFSGWSLGGAGAWESDYFALEGGFDMGVASTDSDVIEIDESYFGFSGKLGAMVKYTYNINESISVIPFVRAGVLLEMATNDLALLSYSIAQANDYNRYNTAYNYDYIPLGSTFLNIFANYSIGTSLVWEKWMAGVELGKYQIVGGDLDPEDDTAMQMPDPLFLRLSIGRLIGNGTLSLGYRLDFWDDVLLVVDNVGSLKGEMEWSGHSFDISYQADF